MKLVEEYLHSIVSFNTASGKYCYSILFVFPSFQSGTRDVRTSSSLCSSAVSHPSSHTASGKYCCNFPILMGRQLSNDSSVSIPQAVSTVATHENFTNNPRIMCRFNTASGKHCCNLMECVQYSVIILEGFNTASGRYCCNLNLEKF